MTTQSPVIPLPPPKERRRLREAASLTQAQLAERLGVSRATMRAWESGRRVPDGSQGQEYAGLLAAFAEPTATQGPGRTAGTVPAPGLPARPGPEPLTAAQSFDALYAFCAPALVRQAYLLSGRRELAREAVERAFQLAWQRWPEVARDRDPAGWVRAVAYDCALSPWHRFRPRYRNPEPPPADPADRVLLRALLKLPPTYRRTLVLYDGVGLDLPETAAETEASTPAAASRLTHAREALAAAVPALADPAELHRRLLELASAERLGAARPTVVRTVGERRNVFWTRAAIAFTVTIIGATTLTLRTAPNHYEAPLAPAQAVRGVPPPPALGPLSQEEQALRAKLRREKTAGPERLAPETR
ncbi:sigma factor-like helix-turn-helix DNA-binding protein [Streptomyces sp. NPDC052301]|uniref:sigma factor-like helix-turn-helix DNA-binding protein n=1 Tax=Streptomyces sp. NPDC052301 TaxID=3365687 RepID=UPI0037D2D73D